MKRNLVFASFGINSRPNRNKSIARAGERNGRLQRADFCLGFLAQRAECRLITVVQHGAGNVVRNGAIQKERAPMVFVGVVTGDDIAGILGTQ